MVRIKKGPIVANRPGSLATGQQDTATASGRWHRIRPHWMILAIVGLVAAACSSSPSASSSNTASSQPKKLQSLTIGVGTPIAMLSTYVAEEKGYFKKNGLNITYINGGASNVDVDLTSHKAQLVDYALTGPIVVAQGGIRTEVVWGEGGGPNGAGMMVGNSSVSSLAQLQSMKSCTIGTFPAASIGYLFAAKYVKDLHLNCTIAPRDGAPILSSELVSGQLTAVVASYTSLVTAISTGKVHILVDVRKPGVGAKYLGTPFVNQGYYGLPDWLKAHPKAVEEFIAAQREADRYMLHHSASTVAQVLSGSSALATFNLTELKNSVSEYDLVIGAGTSNLGHISATQWNTLRKAMTYAAIPGYNANSSATTYKQLVNMSYFNASLKTYP